MANATQDTPGMVVSRMALEGAGNVTSTTTPTGASAAVALAQPQQVSTEILTLHGATPAIALPVPAGAGARKRVVLIQDATGSRIPTWSVAGGAIKWVGAAAPTLQTAAAGTDMVDFFSPDGVNWWGTPALHIA